MREIFWGEYGLNILLTILLILLTLGFKAFSSRAIKRWNIRSLDQRRRWVSQARFVTLSILILGLIIIWASEIRTLALSLAALAVAIVIGFKELLSGLLGSLLKTSSQSFRLGDRITVGEYRGDVMDTRLLTTSLLEVDSSEEFTGRALVIPNSLFLSEVVKNESIGQFHCLHHFKIQLPYELGNPADWKSRAETLAWRESRQYMKATQRLMDRFSQSKTIEGLKVVPRVWIVCDDPKAFHLHIRIPCRQDQRGKVESQIKEELFRSSEKVFSSGL